MEIKETIDLVAYAIKRYRDPETKRGFSLLEYYSITDLKPKKLATEAFKLKMCSSGTTISAFDEENFWNSADLKMEDRFRLFHSFNGVELTQDDKLSIYERLVSKRYPLLEGVYDREAYYYANGIDLSKEDMKNKVIAAYNKDNPHKKITETVIEDNIKVLKKSTN